MKNYISLLAFLVLVAACASSTDSVSTASSQNAEDSSCVTMDDGVTQICVVTGATPTIPTPTPVPDPTVAPTFTPTPTVSPTSTPTVQPTPTPTPRPTSTPLPTPTTTPPSEPEVSAPPAYGFAEAQGLTGGLAGESYVVTSLADSGPGTYRDALSRDFRYITFDQSLDGQTILLNSSVRTQASNLTLDGSGIDIKVSKYATKFEGTNIVVAGMEFKGMIGSDNEDALTFRSAPGTQVFGVYGNKFETATDGLLDVIWNDGHDVYGTICGNVFMNHDKTLLIHSGSPEREGGTYHITLCNNLFYDTYQRTPLSRDALVHQYNDVFELYGKPDGAGGGSKSGVDAFASQHLVENIVAIPRAKNSIDWAGARVTNPRTEAAGPQRSGQGDIKITGSVGKQVGSVTAQFVEFNPNRVFTPPYEYDLLPASEVETFVDLTAGECIHYTDRAVNPCGVE